MDVARRNLIVIFISNLVASTGMAGFLPAFPIILPKLGVTDPGEISIWSGLLWAAAPFSAAISGPLWGALGDRIGRKIMVLRALAGLTVFVGMMSFVSNPWALLMLRLGQGVFSGFIAPSLTLVSVHTPASSQGLIAALLQAALVAGGVMGPPIGGWMLDPGGSPSLVFATAAGAAAVSGLLVAIFAHEDVRPALSTRPESAASAAAFVWSDIKETFAEPTVRRLLLALFVVRFGISCVDPLFAIYVKTFEARSEFVAAHYAFANGALVSATPLGNLLALPFWGRAGDRRGYRWALIVAAGGAGLFYAPQSFAPDLLSLFIVRFFAGVFLSGVVPAAYGMVAEETPVSRRGSSYSLTFSAIAFANSLAPVTGGFLLSSGLPVRMLFLCSAVPMLGAAIWASRWPAKNKI